ncbi:MAG: hypothetical protein E6J99_03650 [Methanobacteriota archaeon]|nr:MAG: hypothetical protein E6J99_03650 [Euryarchaeota archaeon]
MADQPKPGSIVHVEFHVKDRKKVENFYGLQPGNWPSGVINYIFVESIEPFQERIKKAGGKIIAPKMEIPGQGWFAVFEDPSGTRMALWQPSPQSMQSQNR